VKKVLITGGAGFIGTHLAKRLLAEDFQIDMVDNFVRGKKDGYLQALARDQKLRLLNRNLLQPGALDDLGNDYLFIYHLAAIIGVANVLERPYSVLKDNVGMMITLLAFAKRQVALERFLFTSTSEVYAGTLKHFTLPVPTSETTPLALTELDHPRTSYMLSKIYGEALCQQAGVPFTIIRPHNIYGPRMGMAHVIPELLQKAFRASKGDSLEVHSIDHKRTFCYVNDAVEILKLAAEFSQCQGQTLNVGNQQPEITIGELAKIILKTVDKDLPIKALPATPGSPERRAPDMSKTTALTRHVANIGLEQGIKQTFQWYRDQVFSNSGR
jgi:nucleoside-diphosphate-sugar epimerase